MVVHNFAVSMGSSDSEDDVPLLARASKVAAEAKTVKLAAALSGGSNGAGPSSGATKHPSVLNGTLPQKRPVPKKAPVYASEGSSDENESDESSDSEEDAPLSQRLSAKKRKPPASSEARPKRARTSSEQKSKKSKEGASGDEIKWTTLVHHGVLFPPEYQPHGVKMLYDGKPVDLTPEQEEVATMFAVMKDTEYMNKPVFLKNFWEGFKEVLGKNHVIKCLENCDFTPMYEWHMSEREKKKTLTKEEKQKIKEEKDASEGKYKYAIVDGRQEPVGNFRVEPPGLFRGRGEHPRMGKIKKRIYPKDIVMNIGENTPIPEHPYPGQRWKEVRHDHTVTWLAYWKDTISAKDFKYVWLGATSTFKADSDLQKYEKARKLKELIGDIRRNYERDWDSKDQRKKQMAVALYFIDKLALRAGHEKDDDEADTVGCCTLKCENVEITPPSHVKFDFLGKDSIRYENTVEVHAKVYANIEWFLRVDQHGKRKNPNSQLFDAFDATDLNKELKNLMDGLSVKVFRTYNASVTLDRLLSELEAEDKPPQTVDELKVDYDKANKEVAILCNHQRSVPKAHENQMEKMQEKLQTLNTELEELEDELKYALKGKPNKQGKVVQPDVVKSKIEKKRQAIAKAELQVRSKEDLKTVALGTSKINYMDPRITIAWCKRNDVPIEKIFNKSLLGKFNWAMDVEPSFRF